MCTEHPPYKLDPGNTEREFFFETDWALDVRVALKLVEEHFREFHPDFDPECIEAGVVRFHTYSSLSESGELEFIRFRYCAS